MAESYSFFNSKDHDRVYNARHWADYFYPLFRSGVFNGNLQVVENGGMRVKISDGYAWIDGYLYHLTGGLILDLETASGNMNRIDNIVIRLDLTNRWVRGFVVSGSYYSGKASPPERAVTSTIHELVVARINVPAGATQITQDMIEDTRMNNDLCGWVVGTVKEIDYSQIYAQFTAYQNKKVKEVDEWQALEEAALSTWVALLKKEKTEQLQKLITDFENIKDTAQIEFEDWFTGNTNNWEEEWTTWFNNLKEQLTDNAVTNLQSQIGILGNLKTTSKSDLVAAINEVKDSSGVTGVKGNNESSYRKGNVNLTPANIGAVNKTGDTMTGTLTSSKTSNTYIAGNQGQAIINSTAAAGSYTMLDKLNSTNGYFTDGVYQSKRELHYTPKSTVDAGTNSVGKTATLLDESGNSSFPGTVTATGGFKGNLTGNATTATKATQDGLGNVIKDTYAPKDSVLKLVETGEFTNDTITLPLKIDATYMLVTREIAVSTNKVYGYRVRIYATPKSRAVVPSAANAAASTNAGVTLGTSGVSGSAIVANETYGITLKANSTYMVSYALYEFDNSYGAYYVWNQPSYGT